MIRETSLQNKCPFGCQSALYGYIEVMNKYKSVSSQAFKISLGFNISNTDRLKDNEYKL